MTKCLVSGCNNKYRSIGLCSTHWKINKKYGSPNPKCFCGQPVQTFAGNVGAQTLCQWHFFEKRYWDNVDKKSNDECWEWKAARNKFGYGVIYYDGKNRYAHRLALQLSNIYLEKDDVVCHSCDNPSCSNPNHLFIGKQSDNIKDMIEKRRNQFGENTYNAKLSNDDIIEIRKLYFNGITQNNIAKMFSINQGHVSDIINMKKRKIS